MADLYTLKTQYNNASRAKEEAHVKRFGAMALLKRAAEEMTFYLERLMKDQPYGASPSFDNMRQALDRFEACDRAMRAATGALDDAWNAYAKAKEDAVAAPIESAQLRNPQFDLDEAEPVREAIQNGS